MLCPVPRVRPHPQGVIGADLPRGTMQQWLKLTRLSRDRATSDGYSLP
jgi:hypothetical protein